jgi:hypothetical protein
MRYGKIERRDRVTSPPLDLRLSGHLHADTTHAIVHCSNPAYVTGHAESNICL